MRKEAPKNWRDIPPPVVDKEEFNRRMDEIEARHGIVPDPEMTIEKLRELMIEEGIRPEANILSREILRMRNHEDAE